jgi:hypothetical protein
MPQRPSEAFGPSPHMPNHSIRSIPSPPSLTLPTSHRSSESQAPSRHAHMPISTATIHYHAIASSLNIAPACVSRDIAMVPEPLQVSPTPTRSCSSAYNRDSGYSTSPALSDTPRHTLSYEVPPPVTPRIADDWDENLKQAVLSMA